MSEGTIAAPAGPQVTGTDSLPRILIIDDEAAIRESLETLLSLEGYRGGERGERRAGSGSHRGAAVRSGAAGSGAAGARAGSRSCRSILEREAGAAGDHDYGVRHGGQRRGCDSRRARRTSCRSRGTTRSCWRIFARRLARYRAEEENVQLKRALKQRYNFENIVGKSERCCASSTWWRRWRRAVRRC